jgi:hypothetical protein
VSERYIVIPNWDTFQHYSNRDPVWIKVYTRLCSDEGFRELTFHQRGVLISLWIEYARSGRQLRDNTATLTRQLGHRVLRRDIEALTYAGFITFSASAPLAQRREEKKRKEPPSIPPTHDRVREPTEAEIVRARENRESNGYVEGLKDYTGCKIVRGEVGISHVYDPLGTEPKPVDWPYSTPTRQEILEALARRRAAHLA